MHLDKDGAIRMDCSSECAMAGLLAALLNNPGKVLTQRQLLNQVWGPNAVEHSHYCLLYTSLRPTWR